MKKVKSFDLFLNEELKPTTYKSAADKFEKKGHYSRAIKLRLHSKSLIDEKLKEIDPVTIEMYGNIYFLGPDNIKVDDSNYPTVEVNFISSTPIDIPDDEEPDEEVFCIFLNNDGVEYDGLMLPNRNVAGKVLRLVKKYCKIMGSDLLNNRLSKVSPNDLFEEPKPRY